MVTSKRYPVALILDLDDTILDDSSSVQSAWRDVCVDAATTQPSLAPERLVETIFQVRDWYWSDPERHRVGRQDLRATSAKIVHLALQKLGIDDEKLARAIAFAYRDRRDAALRPLPGAIETLAALNRRGFPLALLTNGAGPAQRAKIDRFDLAKYFRLVLIEGEFGAGKPNERVYRHALTTLEARPDQTWIVGDNLEWEVLAPSQLGLWTVWVDRTGNGVPADSLARPDQVIPVLSDLLALLDG